jgi:hypothetical protein
MGATNIPYGVTSFGTAYETGITSITGVGTITAPNLSTVTHGIVSLAGSAGTATTEVFSVSGTAHSTNKLIVRTHQITGAAGTVAANVSWTLYGTLA